MSSLHNFTMTAACLCRLLGPLYKGARQHWWGILGVRPVVHALLPSAPQRWRWFNHSPKGNWGAPFPLTLKGLGWPTCEPPPTHKKDMTKGYNNLIKICLFLFIYLLNVKVSARMLIHTLKRSSDKGQPCLTPLSIPMAHNCYPSKFSITDWALWIKLIQVFMPGILVQKITFHSIKYLLNIN